MRIFFIRNEIRYAIPMSLKQNKKKLSQQNMKQKKCGKNTTSVDDNLDDMLNQFVYVAKP